MQYTPEQEAAILGERRHLERNLQRIAAARRGIFGELGLDMLSSCRSDLLS